MKLLVTAATDKELQFIRKRPELTVANTGAGLVSTAYNLTRILRDRYDLAVNIGVAGSFEPSPAIGEVLVVGSETFGDFGVSSPAGFSTCFEEGLLSPDVFPFAGGMLFSEKARETADALSLRCVRGLTVNTVSGERTRIEVLRKKFSPDVETMEGAAFFLVCLCEHVPFVEIRSVSNIVEPRDKSRWNMRMAIENLSDKVNSYIDELLQ
ncbi:MAG: futalosine hydrolase [Prevotellaceae bacterium]|nr:futalosine hydrolase [Prevotellaceae bacterium]